MWVCQTEHKGTKQNLPQGLLSNECAKFEENICISELLFYELEFTYTLP